MVLRWEILLCGEQWERFRRLAGKDARDSCAGGQIAAGFPRSWNRLQCGGGQATRRPNDRAWFSVARTRPVHLRVHQDRLAAESVSHSAALTGGELQGRDKYN